MRLHDAVIVGSSECAAQGHIFPIGRCFRDQKMKHRVIRSGYSAPQTQLGRWSDADKLKRLRKQIVMVRHLYPVGIAAAVLFGLASKVDIRLQAPVFNGSYGVEKGCRDPAREVGDSIFADIRIREKDTEE